MKTLIGIDSGGTSCRFVLCDESGAVLAQTILPGHNPHTDGLPALESTLRRGLDTVTAGFGGRAGTFDALHAGIAGSEGANHSAVLAMLQTLLPGCARIRLSSDAVIALSSGLGTQDGAVLIAGTGTVGFLRRKGELSRFGGWGYLLDHAGSGWHIGRDGFSAALACADAGLPATVLTALYEQALGCGMTDAVSALYRGDLSLSALAPLVFRAAKQGDAPALRIVRDNAQALFETIMQMQRAFGAELPVVLAGGLWKEPLYAEELTRLCAGKPIRLIHPALPPVFGAILLAAAEAGLPEYTEFALRFAERASSGIG